MINNLITGIMAVWSFFANNILTQPAYMIGFIVLIGYLLEKKPWYDSLAGFLKATIGYMILMVGSSGLVNGFRPILTGLKDRFHLTATVIDPYFGQNAVTDGVMKTFGRSFGDVMILLLIAFVFNILLVRFSKYTKLRAVFTTGNVQVQQAATGFWILLFAIPSLNRIEVLLVMGVLLGLYWAVGSNMTIKPVQELTDGGGFAVAHQQMFGIALVAWLSDKMKKSNIQKGKRSATKLEDVSLPGFLRIFNENMVATAILMFLFFGIIMLVLGENYFHQVFIETKGVSGLAKGASFFFYILTTSLGFAVNLAILQLGVRTFVGELTESFTGISDTILPNSVPGIDVAATFAFGEQNAVTIGFLFGALGQFLAIGALMLFHSPTIIIAGFIPLFFDNAVFGVIANNRAGAKAAMILPFFSGIIQVVGAALISTWIGMSKFGGYLGMFDWDTVWPGFTVILKYLGYVGIVVVALILILIPQLQYRKDPKNYFLMVEDYEAYKEKTK
ncbi:PTS ascorbate transporter subunit IIC [Leuconostoc citreum]|uniref:Ascorbate-specific PTS system EIIC component n=1 Tax=Leuconostoc citreum TaxID=33964 RepID=A0A5A5U408_LEUCI|nr:PTS ascorbate transporter subunit IIC [Leuconostoc citreum]MCP1276502.1 PTS ascorbate transporter subunit IIC [Leuconostoc citreum]MCQ6659228.1 PTS ascorbate transporter subunit IIC [Leuconostoc citreum]MCS8594389.1 PTS ascorbate transporter subunit IIC [Leuconostoc citreum]MCT3067941.1 PTS ascorbate transporter subunit IIC [Leuconostoc citreum]QEA45734.1 PTS ascorbate transporter subunit IIC [Leuconostoc citreum]